jgi:DNA-binding NarL/FixJ family response regulator
MRRGTPGVVECLARYFPGSAAARRLPRAVADWLGNGSEQPFTARTAAARLHVRHPKNAERPLLLFSEEINVGPDHGPPLTSRENKVLQWLAEGKSNAEIAKILGVAPGTVKLHVEHILAKLGVENRTAAASYARRTRIPPATVAREQLPER